MKNSVAIDFYLGEPKYGKIICRAVGASFQQPSVGDLVTIMKDNYIVVGHSFTVDYAGEPGQRVVCNVCLKAVPK